MGVGKSPTARVIVADDEPLIRWSISEALAREGYHVEEAHNGARMLEQVGVVHAGRAGRLAGQTTEAEVHLLGKVDGHGELIVGDGAHESDSPAW